MGAAGAVVSPKDDQLTEASLMDVTSWSWESDLAVSVSMRAPLSVSRTWRMWYSDIIGGVVMDWSRNSTVSETCSALVSCGMIRWQQ